MLHNFSTFLGKWQILDDINIQPYNVLTKRTFKMLPEPRLPTTRAIRKFLPWSQQTHLDSILDNVGPKQIPSITVFGT